MLGQQVMEIRRNSKEVIVRRILDLDERIWTPHLGKALVRIADGCGVVRRTKAKMVTAAVDESEVRVVEEATIV